MNNLTTLMLNDRPRLTSVLNTAEKYGFMINMFVGKKYPNGGWCNFGFNDRGFTSTGSWGPCCACTSLTMNDEYIWFTLTQDGTDIIAGGNNYGGSPVQVKWWNPIYTNEELLGLGYNPKDVLVCWVAFNGLYDTWGQHHGTIHIQTFINYCKQVFLNNPNGHRGGYPSGHLSRGSGKNKTPTFFYYGIITAFRDIIYSKATN